MNYQEEGLSLKKIYSISIILLITYGLYKNGLYYIINKMGNITDLFHLIILVITGLSIGLLFDYLTNKKIGKFTTYTILQTLILPFQTIPLFYGLYLIITCYLLKKIDFKIHPILLFSCLFILIFRPSYANNYEINTPMFYGTIDTLFGKSIGGIFSTNIFLMIITYLFLISKIYYKKEMPFISIVTFSLITLIYDLINGDYQIILHLLNSSVYFVSIYLLPLNEYSPLKKKNQYIYAILNGILMFLLNLKIPYFGVVLSALIINILSYLGKLLSKKAK